MACHLRSVLVPFRQFLIFLPGLLLLAGCSGAPGLSSAGLVPVGQEQRGPWWMRETAMAAGGVLDLKTKPWWARAAQLKDGERFTLDVDGRLLMLVRREKIQRRTGAVDGIVWVVDDDADDSVAKGGDTDSDCYVVDYGCDGLVDRIVDYIDRDHDGRPDEMDIRYFEGNGELRSVWCGMDLDRDGLMWDLKGYEYSANFFASDPYGNNMIYMNKFDPTHGEWVPISECPFAFYDTDHDGYSEVVVRYSAAPIGYNTSTDADYANDANRYRGPWSEDMGQMGVVNIRYSFDADNLSGKDRPLHYDFGFNLIGAAPYRFRGQDHFNLLRRPPQVTKVVPFDSARSVCDTYPAVETGFSWQEHEDSTISIGDGARKALDQRWEGVFWTWERRFMGNTGGPNQKWNMRREWTDRPANRRELYYSEIDGRIHLFGAKEGWVQIGNFAGQGPIGEVRMFDTDGNGYFNRWEVYLGDSPVPVRVSSVRNERARRIPFDYDKIVDFYTREVLPGAMAANERFMKAMSRVRPFTAPAGLQTAVREECAGFRRYAQDVALELQYQDLRRALTEQAHKVLREAKRDDLRTMPREQRETKWNSAIAWGMLRELEKLDAALGSADATAAEKALSEMFRIQETVK